jgi:hypothetical protein
MAKFNPSWLLISAVGLFSAVNVKSADAGPAIQERALTVSSATGRPGFTLLDASQTRLTFTNAIGYWESVTNRVLNNGSGVAAGDFDQDGNVDLFFCSLNQRNRLFKNLGGWQFKDVTDGSGLRFPPAFYRAAVFADINGDTWLDLLVGTANSGVRCYLNNGQGKFSDFTAEANTTSPFANATLTLADIDGNGTLDLYVCNNRGEDIRDRPNVPMVFVNKKPTVPPELRHRISIENGVLQEAGEPDILYLSDGYGHFRSVSWTNGAYFDAQGEVLTNAPLDWGLCASFRDLNNDGAPDLYVCNDYWTPDHMWMNGGRGRFKEVDSLALRKIPVSSMGADFSDINRDGHVDVFAVDMLSRSSELRRRQTVAKRAIPPRPGDIESRLQAPQNVLLLARGDGTYAEIAWLTGLAASDWSWCPLFLDVDLDGFDDLLISAGHIRDIQDLDANDRIRAQQGDWRGSALAATNVVQAFFQARHDHSKLYPPLNMPVVSFRNRGDLHFDETTSQWGLNVPGVNHGMIYADLDNDGDLDVIVNRLGSPAALFRNDAAAPRIAVRLRGRPPNTQAIGSKIELLGGAVSNQIYEVTCGGHYMSGSDTRRVLAPGPGPAAGPMSLRITWRDGATTIVTNVKSNHRYEIDEAGVSRTPKTAVRPEAATPIFEDTSSWLNHQHHDDPFDDLARQPSLPRKLDQGGPGLAWFDLDNDGWDDLIVGAGKGGTMGVYQNEKGKSFRRETNSLFAGVVSRDQTAILGWHDADGHPVILAGRSRYEAANSAEPVPATAYDLKAGKIVDILPGDSASMGPLALGDVDGDGDLDLFVGGQVMPGHYPAPASSRLFRRTDGKWQLDEQNRRVLEKTGMVNGAVWSDLDADGFPELLLACEWGPVRVFRNRSGSLAEATTELGLSKFTGLWQSVTTGDMNGDGQLDIVAGNWGWNSEWQASAERPLTLYYGDLAGRESTEIIEAEFDGQRGQFVPRHLRDVLTAAIPWLPERFPSHTAWSRATVADLLGERRDKMHELTAATLSTTIFINRGDRFEAVPLPNEAQFAPVFGLAVADVDGDGKEDILLAQNFFAFRLEDSRLDAGRGLLLKGERDGKFVAVPGQNSGIKVYGEQRGLAVCDFDKDGRTDFVIGQNSAPTKLFHNVTGRPGLRVQLAGPAGNPRAIGAIIQLKCAGQWGPARELHSGSGYWSQDSHVAVLATPDKPESIRVTWPGGRKTEMVVPPNTSEFTIRP